MDLKVQRDLFIGFFRSTMLGYGGGPSAIPLVHAEVVKRYRWMNDEEFSDVLALGNTLPGPIATKMAGYIGYRVGGTLGMINALVATVLPTVILMIVLIGFLAAFRDSKIVQGMTQAVSPVVGVMLATLAYDFFKQSKKKKSGVDKSVRFKFNQRRRVRSAQHSSRADHHFFHGLRFALQTLQRKKARSSKKRFRGDVRHADLLAHIFGVFYSRHCRLWRRTALHSAHPV